LFYWHAPLGDPHIEFPCKQLRDWFFIWDGSSGDDQAFFLDAWRIERDACLRTTDTSRWRRIRGPVGATVLTLLDAKWEPLTPTIWRFNGVVFAVGTAGFARADALRRFRQALWDQLWAREAWRPLGAGLERGAPHLDGLILAQRRLRKLGVPGLLAALDVVAAGGAIPELTFAKPGHDRWGQLHSRYVECDCGMTLTAEHALFDCIRLRDVPGDFGLIKSSAWVRKSMPAMATPCLWGRGLVPGNVGRDADREAAVLCTAPPPLDVPDEAGWVWATDAGSSASSIVPRPLRSVCGAIAGIRLSSDGVCTDLAVQRFATPGRQTVPRGELHAWTRFARAAPSAAVCVDASYVVDGVSAGEARRNGLVTGLNGDLWTAAFAQPAALPCKVKSHVDKAGNPGAELEKRGMSIAQFAANAVADAVAGSAVAAVAPPASECEAVSLLISAAAAAACRAAWLVHHRWQSRPEAVPLPAPLDYTVPSPHLVAKAAFRRFVVAGHTPHARSGALVCARCQAPLDVRDVRVVTCPSPVPLPSGLPREKPVPTADTPVAVTEYGSRAERKRRLASNCAARRLRAKHMRMSLDEGQSVAVSGVFQCEVSVGS